LALLAGMVATMSKSVVFSVPAMGYLCWREPRKRAVLVVGVVAAALIVGWLKYEAGDTPAVKWLTDAITRRLEKSRASFHLRLEVARYAIGYLKDCLWLGYGIEGTRMVFFRDTSTANTVHVYYLGLIIIAGLPAAVLWVVGVGTLMTGLLKQRDWTLAVYLGSHLLALLALTVLNLSATNMPLMVAGAVVSRGSSTAEPSRSPRAAHRAAVRRAAA